MRASSIFTSTLLIALAACAPIKRSNDIVFSGPMPSAPMGGSITTAPLTNPSKRDIPRITNNAIIKRQDDEPNDDDLATGDDFQQEGEIDDGDDASNDEQGDGAGDDA